MAEFVLVPGAWLGSWAWGAVEPHLRAAGHGVTALTLSGVAERRDVPAGQQTHVQDILDAVEQPDLHQVVLVGHSYSGIPVGQAAERIGARLAQVVFVDSNVPRDGESFVSGPYGAPVVEAIAANDGCWPVPDVAEFADHGLTDAQISRMTGLATPHPGASLTEPAVLSRPLDELPATYVKCLLDWPEPSPEVAALLRGESWRLVEMGTGHWPMFSQPQELAEILVSAAAG